MIFTPIARGSVSLWAMTPVLLVIYFLIFLWLGVISSLRRTPLDPFILLFVALAFISSIFSINKYESFNALLRILAYVGLYYVILNNFDTGMRNRLLGLILGIGIGLSVYGLLQYVGILDHSWWFSERFIAASFVNHNHFAGYLELVIPLAVGILADKRTAPFHSRLGLLLALCIMSVAFIFAQSRAGWLSLAVSLFVMNILLIKRGVLNRKSLAGLVIILLIVFVFFSVHGKQIISDSGIATDRITQDSDLSLKGRLDIWQASLKMFCDKPVMGTGIGCFDSGFYQYRPVGFDARAVYAHNDYLHMAVEMGILAPLLMIGILIVLLKRGLRRNVDFRILGCAIGILSLALHGLADFNFHIPANMLLLIIYAGFVMSASFEKIPELDPDQPTADGINSHSNL